MLSVAGALFFAYQKWPEAPTSLSNSGTSLRPALGRSTESTSPGNATTFVSNKAATTLKPRTPKAQNPTNRREGSEKNDSDTNEIAEQVQRLAKVKLPNPSLTRRPEPVVNESKIEPSRQVKIPDIRLPAAEVQEQDVTSSSRPILLDPSRLRCGP